MLPERPFSYRAQDDEDHRQALCGLVPDDQWEAERELEEFARRHYDFIFAPVTDWLPGAKGGGDKASSLPVATFFALAPQARSRGQRMWEEHLPAGCCMSSGPTPYLHWMEKRHERRHS